MTGTTHRSWVLGVTYRPGHRAGPYLAGCSCGWRDECPRLKKARAHLALEGHRVDVRDSRNSARAMAAIAKSRAVQAIRAELRRKRA